MPCTHKEAQMYDAFVSRVLSVEQLVGFQWHIFIFEMENFTEINNCYFFFI